MASPNSPIVVLDSGLGGLTVVRALRAALPAEDILYFGDTARVPYGTKSPATVTSFVRQVIQWFAPHDPKHVVIACNTATALALPTLREDFPNLSMSGVVEPGARAAVAAAGEQEYPYIGIIATEATIRSRAYERAIVKRKPYARLVCRATPLLVPIIEEGRGGDDPLVRLALRQYLRPMKERGIGVLVLGCTHYPVLKDSIQRMTGPDVHVIDSAQQCAEDVTRRLATAGILRAPHDGDQRFGKLQCFVTDDSPRFGQLAGRFLGLDIQQATWVPTDELYALPQPATLRTSARSAV